MADHKQRLVDANIKHSNVIWSLDVFDASLDEMVKNQEAATPEWKKSQLVFLEQGNDRAGLQLSSSRSKTYLFEKYLTDEVEYSTLLHRVMEIELYQSFVSSNTFLDTLVIVFQWPRSI